MGAKWEVRRVEQPGIYRYDVVDSTNTVCKELAAQGISRLVIGMKASDAIARMQGISCSGKGTSCPDQLSIALTEALKKAQSSGE